MKLIFKKGIGRFFLKLGLFHIFRFFTRRKLKILTFHNPNFEEFENQIRFIKHYYTPVTLQDVTDFYIAGKSLPDHAVLITFDDGYRNLKDFVDPILKKYGMRALVFLPSA